MRLRVLRALCLLCGLSATSYAAVGDYIGKTIASVHLVAEGRETTDPVLTALVETVPGTPLSMLQVRESVAHLFSLGQFNQFGQIMDMHIFLRHHLRNKYSLCPFLFGMP